MDTRVDQLGLPPKRGRAIQGAESVRGPIGTVRERATGLRSATRLRRRVVRVISPYPQRAIDLRPMSGPSFAGGVRWGDAVTGATATRKEADRWLSPYYRSIRSTGDLPTN